MNSPKLRFKNFNDEWNKYKLKDFANKITNKNKNYLIKNVLSNSAIYGIVRQAEYFDKNIANNENINNYYLVNRFDFIYNPRCSIEAPFGPINMYEDIEIGIVSPLYLCFNINEKINPYFLKWYYKSSKWYKYIYYNSNQGARHDRQSIQDDVFFNMNIILPSLEEQTKIANFLSLIDRKIELQEKLVENLKLYKKGLLKKVFSNNLGWKTAKLSKYFDITSSKRVFQSEWTTNGIPFYRAREIVKLVNNNYIDNELFISKSMYDEYSKKYGKIQKNDLLITGVGTIGICYLVKETDEFYFKDGNLIWLKPKNNNINSKFVKYLFQSNYIINQINNFGNGTTVATYTIDNANETKIFIPSIEEQNRIANLFTSLDKKIELETKKLQDLKTYKKGLLQQMFI